MRNLCLISTLALLASCGWESIPTNHIVQLDGAMWDAQSGIVSSSGLYFRLPAVNGLGLVSKDGTFTHVSLDGPLTNVFPSPDGDILIGLVDQTTCPDDEDAVLVTDCDEPETSTQLVAIVDGLVINATTLEQPFNAISWNETGTNAIAYIDSNLGDVSGNGVVSLTTVLVITPADSTITPVQVGFSASEVLFHPETNRAVVLSQSEVAVIDLAASPPATVVTYPLTLDPDDVVNPVAISLTPDGGSALISAHGTDALYILDLVNPSVNMVSLSNSPAAMAVSSAADRTFFTFDWTSTLDIMDHDYFDVESISLDEPMSRIDLTDNYALLSSENGYRDVYKLAFDLTGDETTFDLTEYRLQGVPNSLALAPSGEFAVALTDNATQMEIVDLRLGSDNVYPYALESQGIAVAFSQADDGLSLLLLQSDLDYLFSLNLYTNQAEELELSSPPVDIGALSDGTFFITHDVPSGLVTFYDPATGSQTEVAGFALDGVTDPKNLSGLDQEVD
jgi:hypothetical protein